MFCSRFSGLLIGHDLSVHGINFCLVVTECWAKLVSRGVALEIAIRTDEVRSGCSNLLTNPACVIPATEHTPRVLISASCMRVTEVLAFVASMYC